MKFWISSVLVLRWLTLSLSGPLRSESFCICFSIPYSPLMKRCTFLVWHSTDRTSVECRVVKVDTCDARVGLAALGDFRCLRIVHKYR
ncbi:hypothetical protein KC367_g76 [Hortaea werneckii]|nr:hypothetical protein KC367_g76 [Hortaea werneckii]